MARLVQFTNNAKSRLAANITSSATTLSVTPGDGAKFPSLTGSAYFYCTLVKTDGTAEIIKVTARSTDTLTIQRAVEPINAAQTAYAFSAGDRIEIRLTTMGLVGELDRIEEIALISVATKSADYTVTEADIHSLIKVNTTSANKTITLPQISTLNADFDLLIVKLTGDTNTVIIAASGTDVINGSTTYTLAVQHQCAWLVSDRSTNTWQAINSGPVAGNNVVVNSFTGTGSQTAFTLTSAPGIKENTLVYVGGAYQAKANYSVSGTTLTLSTAPANAVPIEIVFAQPIAISAPGDNTVKTASIQDLAVTTTKIANGSITSEKLAAGAQSVTDGSISTVKLADAAVTSAKMAAGAAASNLGTYVRTVNGQSGAVTVASGVSSVDGATGAVSLSALSSFAKTLGANGSQTLPSGLIIKWGYAAISAATVAITFPTAFPNACYSVVALTNQPGNTGGVGSSPTVNSGPTATGVTFSVVSTWAGIFWIAIGS